MPDIILAPSLLSADLLHLAEEIASVEEAGADWHHIDVMDGHFVPPLTFGPNLVKALKKVAKIPVDVHLMVQNPHAVVPDYLAAGADLLTFHVEAATHSHRLIQTIQASGVKAGIALNPGTPLSSLTPLLPLVDMVLLMSVNPGYGGQTFIPESLARLGELSEAIRRLGRSSALTLAVDGGICADTIAAAHQAGAQAFIAGSAVYGLKNRSQALRDLRQAVAAQA